MKFIIGLIIAAVLILAILAAIYGLIHRVQRFSMEIFGTKSLAEGWNRQSEELAVTPKSISGMTRILEPQIQRDFPEFNWMEFRNRAENMLRGAFLAIDKEDLSSLQEGSQELKRQVQGRISQNQAEHVKEHYREVKIHNTEITRYEKKQGTCVITLQSAVGHLHYRTRDGKVISGDDRLTEQTRYNTEILYVQDEKFANQDKAVGITCPCCGAPVTTLGAKRCEYCGSAVTPVNTQVWSIHKFYEVTYQNTEV